MGWRPVNFPRVSYYEVRQRSLAWLPSQRQCLRPEQHHVAASRAYHRDGFHTLNHQLVQHHRRAGHYGEDVLSYDKLFPTASRALAHASCLQVAQDSTALLFGKPQGFPFLERPPHTLAKANRLKPFGRGLVHNQRLTSRPRAVKVQCGSCRPFILSHLPHHGTGPYRRQARRLRRGSIRAGGSFQSPDRGQGIKRPKLQMASKRCDVSVLKLRAVSVANRTAGYRASGKGSGCPAEGHSLGSRRRRQETRRAFDSVPR
jgi:hypothetical protein